MIENGEVNCEICIMPLLEDEFWPL